jgi:drug/metabolite transporter (DMT)-like permease
MTPVFEDIPRHGFGIFLVIVASMTLAVMNGAVKWLTLAGYPTFQIIFMHALIGFCAIAGWLLWTRNGRWIRRVRPMLAAYVAAAVCACYALYYAFGHGQLAQISTITAAAPLLVAVLSFFFLGERLTPWQIILAVTGFAGILMVLQPDADMQLEKAIWVALLGMAALAASQVLVRKLSRTVHTVAFIFYFYFGVLIISGALMDWRPVAVQDWPVILMGGAADVVALVLMYRAFHHAPASLVTPFQYSNIVWNALIGYVIWQEAPSFWTAAGAVVIIGAGILFTQSALVKKQARQNDAPETKGA